MCGWDWVGVCREAVRAFQERPDSSSWGRWVGNLGGAGLLQRSQVTRRQAGRGFRKFREREGGVGKGKGGDLGWKSQ